MGTSWLTCVLPFLRMFMDVHNSLMSKNNSNNDAAADCINNNSEGRGAIPGSC